jgi:hypothetical protein
MRGESLTDDDRRVAEEAYRDWQDSETAPNAEKGDPALGRALRKLALGGESDLSHQERGTLSGLLRASKEQRASRTGPGRSRRTPDVPPAGRGLRVYLLPVAAGMVAVAVVVAAAGLRMRWRRRRPG